MPVNTTSTGATYGKSSDPLCPLGFHPQVRSDKQIKPHQIPPLPARIHYFQNCDPSEMFSYSLLSNRSYHDRIDGTIDMFFGEIIIFHNSPLPL